MNKFSTLKTSAFWRVIAASVALSLLVFAGVFFYSFGVEAMHWWTPSCRDQEYFRDLGPKLSYIYKYHPYGYEIGNICDKQGRVVLKEVNWVSENCGAVMVFAKNGYRGYLDRYSGKILLPATKFTRAYVYSEGRALAVTNDSLFVLDETGGIVKGFAGCNRRDPGVKCFHHGYLPMVGENGKIGLIDRNAEWVLEPEYDSISFEIDKFWLAQKNENIADGEYETAVPAKSTIFDDSLRIVMQGDWTFVRISEKEGFVVAEKDHWQRRYGFDGKLIDGFLCQRVETITYATGEKGYRENRTIEYGEISATTEEYQIEALASLKKYVTSEGWEGLMSQDGRPLTPPIYWSIEAIDKNLYLCKFDKSCTAGVLLNEKGEKVTKEPQR